MVLPSWISVLEPLPVQTTRLGAIVELISSRDIDSTPDKAVSMTSTLPPMYLVVAAFDNTAEEIRESNKNNGFLITIKSMVSTKEQSSLIICLPSSPRGEKGSCKLLETGVKGEPCSSVEIIKI